MSMSSFSTQSLVWVQYGTGSNTTFYDATLLAIEGESAKIRWGTSTSGREDTVALSAICRDLPKRRRTNKVEDDDDKKPAAKKMRKISTQNDAEDAEDAAKRSTNNTQNNEQDTVLVDTSDDDDDLCVDTVKKRQQLVKVGTRLKKVRHL